jgi:hypothetical protein
MFIIAPTIIFGFLSKNKKYKYEVDRLKYQKEILELEIEKENRHIKLLEEENKKFDNIINEK